MLVQAWNFMNINKALPPASPNHGVLKLKSRRSEQDIYIGFTGSFKCYIKSDYLGND